MLDHVQVDTITEEVMTSHQAYHAEAIITPQDIHGLHQPPALLCIHGAVVEIEVKVADSVVDRVPDVLVGIGVGVVGYLESWVWQYRGTCSLCG